MRTSTPMSLPSTPSSGYESIDEVLLPTYTFKYVIVGEVAVGKSCFLLQFTDQRFKIGHELTIGAEYSTRLINYGDKCIQLKIWDTAGSEQFRSIAQNYYRGAVGAFLLYDVTSRNSFNLLCRWLADIRLLCSPGVVIFLVGNKCDLDLKRQVSYEDGLRFARENDLLFMETSAKTARNVDKGFADLTAAVLDKIQLPQPTIGDFSTIISHQQMTIISINRRYRHGQTKCC